MGFSEPALIGGVISLQYSGIFNETNHLNASDIIGQGVTARAYNFAKSWFQEASYVVSTCFTMVKEYFVGVPVEYVTPSDENNRWKEGNKGLYVAIHGLNGRPNIWRKQLALLQKEQPDFEIRIPFVPEKGNCALKKAVKPIEAMIRDYIDQHPDKPICLMGVSNGARIAMELEVRLRDTTAPIFISSVAGALSGTKQMNLLKSLGLASVLYKQVVVEEMLYQSHASKSLLNRIRESLPEGVERVYEFYASPDDFQIKPYSGSLPVLKDKQVNYFLVPGENHNSIVIKVVPIQIRNCMKWMETHSV